MTMSLKQIDRLALAAMLAGLVGACLLSGGCILNPGAQVREALSQTKTYEWTSEGSIRVHGIGPQEEAFLMMEGEIVMGDDGEIDWAASKITHYLKSEPSADEAMAGMAAILIANQKQAEAFYASLESTLELVSSLIPLLVPQPSGEGEGDGP